MSEQTPEGSDQTETADDSSAVEVPNVREGAVSGLDHEPLTPRRTTLVGVVGGNSDATADLPTDDEPDDEQQDGPQEDVPVEGEEEATGDGSGTPAPPIEDSEADGEHLDGGEVTAPDGTPVADDSDDAPQEQQG